MSRQLRLQNTIDKTLSFFANFNFFMPVFFLFPMYCGIHGIHQMEDQSCDILNLQSVIGLNRFDFEIIATIATPLYFYKKPKKCQCPPSNMKSMYEKDWKATANILSDYKIVQTNFHTRQRTSLGQKIIYSGWFNTAKIIYNVVGVEFNFVYIFAF